MIDLHTHSTFSDGSETPATLARMAKEVGLAAIALTDHDTTASHDDMQAACDAEGIELIPGTEISLVDHEFPAPIVTAQPPDVVFTSSPTFFPSTRTRRCSRSWPDSGLTD